MANGFPTSPEVLAEASPYSLNDLAIMHPDELSPEAELAYIEHLRTYRERYERALGTKASVAKVARTPKAKAAAVLLGPLGGAEAFGTDEDLF